MMVNVKHAWTFLQIICYRKGKPVNDLDNPKNGMVVDFGDIKRL